MSLTSVYPELIPEDRAAVAVEDFAEDFAEDLAGAVAFASVVFAGAVAFEDLLGSAGAVVFAGAVAWSCRLEQHLSHRYSFPCNLTVSCRRRHTEHHGKGFLE